MIQRRSGRDRRLRPAVEISEAEQALETVRFLRPEILEFVRRYGPAAATYLDRVIAVWIRGTFAERVAFVKTCSGDPGLSRAWDIIHAAGTLAAPLIPYAVRRYYRQGTIDTRA